MGNETYKQAISRMKSKKKAGRSAAETTAATGAGVGAGGIAIAIMAAARSLFGGLPWEQDVDVSIATVIGGAVIPAANAIIRYFRDRKKHGA